MEHPMKKLAFCLVLLLGLGACGQDSTAPEPFDAAEFGAATDLAFDASFAGDPRVRFIPFVLRLPEHLKLSAEQEASIRALLQQFADATRADHEALAAILKEARAARQAGKTAEEVRAILQQGEPIRLRLVAAEQKLRADLLAVLTAEQKAWVESQGRNRCESDALTESQRTEISALYATFEQDNRADLETIRTTLDRARAAHLAGASRGEIHAILVTAEPAMQRVIAARIQLMAAVYALLTPEQLASGCFALHLRRA
jgi:Spy/CpxP family protein refolding chaperone